MTIVPAADISAIRLDKDQDIIPLTVGLYRLFMASGPAGREAMDLYIHLIFTARLQETQQIRANNVYLARGLSWGIAKVKAAKAWLAEAGLIEYIRTRGPDGLLGEVYIRLRFLPRASTTASRIDQDAPAAPEEYRDDLTPDMFETPSGAAEDSAPEASTGSVIHPVVNHAHGAERQMLKVNKEMLKVKKGKGEARDESPSEGDEPHKAIPIAWYKRFTREAGNLVMPSSVDYLAARDLLAAQGGDVDRVIRGVDDYFGNWQELWFACSKSSRKRPAAQRKREWTFSGFCRHFNEIVQVAENAEPASGAPGAAVDPFLHLFQEPIV